MSGDQIIRKGYWCMLLLCNFLWLEAQSYKYSWQNIHLLYENMEENNEKALPLVSFKIIKLKKIANYKELVYTYEDAIFFSSKVNNKLKYADSAIFYAKKTEDVDLIAKAYTGKGVIHYFHERRYTKALEYYKKALHYSQQSKNEYLKNKLSYLIGTCKAAIGFYDEAIPIFNATAAVFNNKRISTPHSSLYYNYTRGYLNSLHQLLLIYNSQKNIKKSDSILSLPIFEEVSQVKDFSQEIAYYKKEKAIHLSSLGNFKDALSLLLEADNALQPYKDIAAQTRTWYYLAQIHQKLSQKKLAIAYALKVDSICTKYKYYPPILRDNYRQLIHFAAEDNNQKMVKFWSAKIVQVEIAAEAHFPAIAKKLFLLPSAISTSKSPSNFHFGLWGLLALISIGTTIYLMAYSYTQIDLNKLYQSTTPLNTLNTTPNNIRKSTYGPEIVEPILEQLSIFEQNHSYLAKNLSITKLANKLGTNTTHLSFVLNEYKKQNFNTYLKHLRINYITNLLLSDPKYLNYTVDALSECVGISSRQVFSDHFFEITGKRPIDFIKSTKQQYTFKNDTTNH